MSGEFTVVDADELGWCDGEFLGAGLAPPAVLAAPIAQRAFSIVDALVESDERFRSLLLSEPSNASPD